MTNERQEQQAEERPPFHFTSVGNAFRAALDGVLDFFGVTVRQRPRAPADGEPNSRAWAEQVWGKYQRCRTCLNDHPVDARLSCQEAARRGLIEAFGEFDLRETWERRSRPEPGSRQWLQTARAELHPCDACTRRMSPLTGGLAIFHRRMPCEKAWRTKSLWPEAELPPPPKALLDPDGKGILQRGEHIRRIRRVEEEYGSTGYPPSAWEQQREEQTPWR